PSTNSRAGEERRWKPDRARARNAARTAGAVPANRLVRGKHVPHQWLQDWRPGSESNRRTRICSPRQNQAFMRVSARFRMSKRATYPPLQPAFLRGRATFWTLDCDVNHPGVGTPCLVRRNTKIYRSSEGRK